MPFKPGQQVNIPYYRPHKEWVINIHEKWSSIRLTFKTQHSQQQVLSGSHFVHTTFVTLLAAGLLCTSKRFFQHSTTSQSRCHPKSTLTIETGILQLWLNSHFSLPTHVFLNPTTYHSRLPVRLGRLSSWSAFSLLWSHPLIPLFLASPAESWSSCFVLEQPRFIPVPLANAPSNTHWVYPYNISTYWACPTTSSIDSYIIWSNPDRPLHTSLCMCTHTHKY